MVVRLRPTLDTKFHIDLSWWDKNHKDIQLYMRDALCSSCRSDFESFDLDEKIDWVDEETAEVAQVEPLWHTLRACCSQKPGYVTDETPVIDAVFLTFLANGNKPLSVNELYELMPKRPPETLLRMLAGGTTYLGIRPVRNRRLGQR